MRILYDHQVFSLQEMGGISRYFLELMRGIAFDRHFRCDFFEGMNGGASSQELISGVRRFRVQAPKRLHPGRIRYAINEAALSVAAPLLGRYDIYHSTHCRKNRAILHKKLVVTHHDCTYERFPHLFRNSRLVMKLRSEVFRAADAIICVSASTKKDLLEFYDIDPRKVCVIHHGITKLPTPGAEVVCRAPYLLYVGSRAPHKNFPLLLEAFAVAGLSSEFRLVALGGGTFSEAELLKIKSLDLEERIVSMPIVSDAVLASAYAHARLLVYPSMYEGFGFPPLEALSYSCPVLVANASCMPEICGKAAFYFDPTKSDDFPRALLNACMDDSERTAKTTLAPEITGKFRWSICVAKTKELYESLNRSA